LNTHGMKKAAKREEIEKWKDSDVHILAVQETHIDVDVKESMDNYTWYFSRSTWAVEGTRCEAGVGWVVRNDYIKYIQDIGPATDRVTTLTLSYSAPITLISVYAPQAERDEEDKDKFYEQLQIVSNRHKGRGPTYLLGDWNARVQSTYGVEEKTIGGPYTCDAKHADPMGRSDNAICNRQLLIYFCSINHIRLANTLFRNSENKLATYSEKTTKIGDCFDRAHYEQIDFVVAPNRWTNII
jgi:exonuclease III